MRPREVCDAWFKRIWNAGDVEAVDELASPSANFHGLPTSDERSMAGPAAFKAYARAFRQAFPDINVQIVRYVCEGDMIALHCAVKGTNTGPGVGATPTGRAVSFEGMVIARIEGGKLQEGWNCFDSMTMYQQLGLLPSQLLP
jgi:predicted ester cyclase